MVGAGPSGIHMALKLKKLGYQDIVIYEKSGRIGGKSYDVNFKGVPNAMGTIFLEPTYFDNLVPLAREYGVGEIVDLPPVGLLATNQAFSNISLDFYLLSEVSKYTKSRDPQINAGFMIQNILKYIK